MTYESNKMPMCHHPELTIRTVFMSLSDALVCETANSGSGMYDATVRDQTPGYAGICTTMLYTHDEADINGGHHK